MIEHIGAFIDMLGIVRKEVLKIYDEKIDVELKEDDSPLTRADKIANNIITKFLRNRFPETPIISEENKAIPYDQRKYYKEVWMIDPIDGTKEFIKKNGEFTVNIALIRGGQAVFGVVDVPVMEKTYYAEEGRGAYLTRGKATTKLSVRQFRMDDHGLRVLCSRSHLNEETSSYLEKLNNPRTLSRGSSLKLLAIAEGAADLYPRIAPTMEWDTAAAHIIVEEAGGSVVQYETNEPVTYNKENLLNPYFLVQGKVHE